MATETETETEAGMVAPGELSARRGRRPRSLHRERGRPRSPERGRPGAVRSGGRSLRSPIGGARVFPVGRPVGPGSRRRESPAVRSPGRTRDPPDDERTATERAERPVCLRDPRGYRPQTRSHRAHGVGTRLDLGDDLDQLRERADERFIERHREPALEQEAEPEPEREIRERR